MTGIRNLLILAAAVLGLAATPLAARAIRPADHDDHSAGGGSMIQRAGHHVGAAEYLASRSLQLMPGAGGQTGTAAAQAQPDGYTLLFTTISSTNCNSMWPGFRMNPTRLS